MKTWMLTGGFVGFAGGLAISWLQGNDWPAIFWKASVAAYVTGILFRWWSRLWLKNLHLAHLERRALQEQQEPFASTSTHPEKL